MINGLSFIMAGISKLFRLRRQEKFNRSVVDFLIQEQVSPHTRAECRLIVLPKKPERTTHYDNLTAPVHLNETVSLLGVKLELP
jgi:hypothetical protein